MLRDAGRLPGGPTLLAQKNFLVGPRSDPPKPAGAQSSPSPSPSPPLILKPGICPAKPLARGEKRSVLPCVLFPLRKFVFRHLFAEKEPSCDKGNTQKTDPVEPCVHAIPSCCDGGVSLMRRDRSFRGRLPGGPDIGLPVFLRLFQNGFRGATDSPAAQQFYR